MRYKALSFLEPYFGRVVAVQRIVSFFLIIVGVITIVLGVFASENGAQPAQAYYLGLGELNLRNYQGMAYRIERPISPAAGFSRIAPDELQKLMSLDPPSDSMKLNPRAYGVLVDSDADVTELFTGYSDIRREGLGVNGNVFVFSGVDVGTGEAVAFRFQDYPSFVARKTRQTYAGLSKKFHAERDPAFFPTAVVLEAGRMTADFGKGILAAIPNQGFQKFFFGTTEYREAQAGSWVLVMGSATRKAVKEIGLGALLDLQTSLTTGRPLWSGILGTRVKLAAESAPSATVTAGSSVLATARSGDQMKIAGLALNTYFVLQGVGLARAPIAGALREATLYVKPAGAALREGAAVASANAREWATGAANGMFPRPPVLALAGAGGGTVTPALLLVVRKPGIAAAGPGTIIASGPSLGGVVVGSELAPQVLLSRSEMGDFAHKGVGGKPIGKGVPPKRISRPPREWTPEALARDRVTTAVKNSGLPGEVQTSLMGRIRAAKENNIFRVEGEMPTLINREYAILRVRSMALPADVEAQIIQTLENAGVIARTAGRAERENLLHKVRISALDDPSKAKLMRQVRGMKAEDFEALPGASVRTQVARADLAKQFREHALLNSKSREELLSRLSSNPASIPELQQVAQTLDEIERTTWGFKFKAEVAKAVAFGDKRLVDDIAHYLETDGSKASGIIATLIN
jgi:hypothetical protein